MLIVIVIYNKNIMELSIFKKILRENIDIFIYDNSKFPQDIPSLENINIYYEHDEKNSGVSRAYNQAYKKAKELGKKLLLVLDQDSEFEICFVEEYMKMYLKYKDNYLYAPVVTNSDATKIYSPAFMDNFVGKIQESKSFIYDEIYDLFGKSVINSGLMIPLKLFEKIGGYNEKLKLDFSDIYFIEKYKEINSKIVLLSVYLNHSISGDEGKDYSKEYNRFRYYCSASKEMGRVFDTTIFWSPFRRLIRLILKYKKLNFIKVFFEYYIKGKEI